MKFRVLKIVGLSSVILSVWLFGASPLWAKTADSETAPAETDEKADKPCDELCELEKTVQRLELEKRQQALLHEQKTADLVRELEQLQRANELQSAQAEQQLADLEQQKRRLSLENSVQDAQHQQKMVALEQAHSELALKNKLQAEKNAQEEMEIGLEISRLSFESSKLKVEQMRLADRIAQIRKEQEFHELVDKPIRYLTDPYQDGHLVISDRQIEINQVILPGTADYVIERLEFFNNKSEEYPIFLVFGYCPGGSVMEGSRILKAMANSRAPVYVVVKAFAASMAATITTLAERSFAYPDAMLLHHQVWGFSFGNRTEQREQMELLEAWTDRILTPIAEKMELTLDELIAKMYEQNSTGDWVEFADEAQKLGWVTDIVVDIRDESQMNKPSATEEEYLYMAQYKEEVDAEGQRFVRVPRLRPFDVYYLHNPEGYFRY
jgi:ATP-dependent Clp protease protease subunit